MVTKCIVEHARYPWPSPESMVVGDVWVCYADVHSSLFWDWPRNCNDPSIVPQNM